MSTVITEGVLVGVDGSPAASRAVEFAAREARARGLPLTICHVRIPSVAPDLAPALADEAVALAVVDDARDLAAKIAPDVTIVLATRFGVAAAELLALARRADQIVLGARGHGGFASLLLGSVSDQVATHAHVPCTIVRGGADFAAGAPVVVGVATPGEPGLAYAFDLAALLGSPLVAVHAWNEAVYVPMFGVLPEYDTRYYARQARAMLTEATEPWRARYPDVPVDHRGSPRDAALALTKASSGAARIVVGGARHTGMLGGLLGSTSRTVLHHAACPVTVVPRPRAG
ncbi:MAG: universal stress protein [Mycobacteriales bacterium]